LDDSQDQSTSRSVAEARRQADLGGLASSGSLGIRASRGLAATPRARSPEANPTLRPLDSMLDAGSGVRRRTAALRVEHAV
jgi:hypothetical protein